MFWLTDASFGLVVICHILSAWPLPGAYITNCKSVLQEQSSFQFKSECKIFVRARIRHLWRTFLRYWPFVRGIHRSPVHSRHKGQWRRALMFSLICTWLNGWVNSDEAGDLRCHRTHYGVIIMGNALEKSPSYVSRFTATQCFKCMMMDLVDRLENCSFYCYIHSWKWLSSWKLKKVIISRS